MFTPAFHLRLGATCLLLGVHLSLGAQEGAKPTAPPAAPTAVPAKKAPAPKAKPKGKLKPVDINSATKEEISFMLGIDVAVAAKIVAGRPYPTKSRLLTNKIVSAETYEAIKGRIVAGQGSVPR